MKFEYVNGHFSVANNTRGFTYSTDEYVNLEEYNDDDDGGTVIDRKFIIFNNINTNSGFNYGATTADATTTVVVVFDLAVAVLRAFMCGLYDRRRGHKILKQAKLGQFSTN